MPPHHPEPRQSLGQGSAAGQAARSARTSMLRSRPKSNGKCAFRKLVSDFVGGVGLGRDMDADTRDLFVQLCTRVAMIMEDIAPCALTIASGEIEDLSRALQGLSADLDNAGQLLSAAVALAQMPAE